MAGGRTAARLGVARSFAPRALPPAGCRRRARARSRTRAAALHRAASPPRRAGRAPTHPRALPPHTQAPAMWFLISFTCVVACALMVRRAGGGHTDAERLLAHDCYHEALGALESKGGRFDDDTLFSRATDIFLRKTKLYYSRQSARQFVVRWAHHAFTSHDKPRSGRPPRMTDDECALCIAEVRKGYVDDSGRRRGFTDLSHASQFRVLCPTVALCRPRYAADPEGMFQRLKRFDSNLVRIKPTKKRMFTPHQKEERLAYCRLHLGQPPEYFHRFFFIDAKTLLLEPASDWIISYRDNTDLCYFFSPDIKAYNRMAHSNDTIKIEFYAMVNWWGGVCGYVVCQGTTGVEPRYKVCPYFSLLKILGGGHASHAATAACSARAHEAASWSAFRRSTCMPFGAARARALKASSIRSCTACGLLLMHPLRPRPPCVHPSTCTASHRPVRK